MKTIKNALLFIFLIMAIAVDAQDRPLVQYVFGVGPEGDQEELVITVYRQDNGGEFTYKIAGDQNRSGRVTVPEKARRTSGVQVIDYSEGDLILTNESALWISDKLYSDFKKGTAVIDMGAGSENWKLVGKEELPILKEGKRSTIKVLKGTTDRGREVWILDDSKNPIIIKVTGDGQFVLKEII